jgi:hypothetical protein
MLTLLESELLSCLERMLAHCQTCCGGTKKLPCPVCAHPRSVYRRERPDSPPALPATAPTAERPALS